jgi:hypothetical protein
MALTFEAAREAWRGNRHSRFARVAIAIAAAVALPRHRARAPSPKVIDQLVRVWGANRVVMRESF